MNRGPAVFRLFCNGTFFALVLFTVILSTSPLYSQIITYTYDETTPVDGQARNGIGRLTSVTDPTGSTTFAYDGRGNAIRTIKVIEGNAFALKSSFDSLNRAATTTYPDGEVVTYAYDAAGNLQTVTGNLPTANPPITNYVTNITYNASNQRTAISSETMFQPPIRMIRIIFD
jgi:YD repeat-containing protein